MAKTKEILSQQPGAKEVRVDFDTKTATVAVDSGKFNAEDAIAALVDHGFDHSTVKADGKSERRRRPSDSTANSRDHESLRLIDALSFRRHSFVDRRHFRQRLVLRAIAESPRAASARR